MDNFNLKTSFGNPLVTDKNGHTGSFPELELLQQKNFYLEKVGKLAEAHGADRVERWMQFGGFSQAAPDASPSSNSASDASPTSNSADMISEVEALGLELNPKLITQIVNSSVQQVKTAIAKYKTYRQVTNREGLFYRILDNEPKSDSSSL
jgi:hypothetical protein